MPRTPASAFRATFQPAEIEGMLSDPEAARALVRDCMVHGRLSKRALYGKDGMRPHLVSLLDEQHLPIEVENGRLVVGGARVLFGDQGARNGIVHLVHPVPHSDP